MSYQGFNNEDAHSTSALTKKSHPTLDAYGKDKPTTPKMRPKHTPLQMMHSQEQLPHASHFNE